MSASTFGLNPGAPFGALLALRMRRARAKVGWSSAIARGEREAAADAGVRVAELGSDEATLLRAWGAA